MENLDHAREKQHLDNNSSSVVPEHVEGTGRIFAGNTKKHPFGRERPGAAPEPRQEGKQGGEAMPLAKVPSLLSSAFPQPEETKEDVEWS